MPKLTNSAPKYRKHSTGQAFVELGGKRHYLGPYGTAVSKREFDRKVSEWLANGRRDSQQEEDVVSVTELLALWWKWAEKHYRKPDGSDSGKLDAIKPGIRTLRHLFGEMSVDQFGPKALKAIRDHIITKGAINNQGKPTGIPGSRQYANSVTNTVRGVFRWGVSEELVPPEVWHGLQSVRALQAGRCDAREAEPVLPVSDAVVEATVPYLSSVVRSMVRLQLIAGMRPCEVCLLRPCDIDRSGDVWLFVPETHKTEHKGKSRTVFIGPKGQEILRPFLDREPTAHCFSPIEAEAERRAKRKAARKTPLSCGNREGTNRKRKPKCTPHESYTTDSYRKAIQRAAKKAKVESWSPNQLRHSCATMVRRTFGLEAAQVVLGHSAANVTQVYAERDLAKGVSVMKEVG